MIFGGGMEIGRASMVGGGMEGALVHDAGYE